MNFTMDINPGYNYIKKFLGGVQWYLMECKDIISSICFKLKIENGNLVSFKGQSISFRLSIKELYIKMTRTLIKSRLPSNKHKPKHKQEITNTKSNLPPNIQSFKQKLLSGNGFFKI